MNAAGSEQEFAALIGIDWADRKHDVCVLDSVKRDMKHSVIRHTPEAIDEWACGLRQRFEGRPVAACLEQSKGALIYALLKHDFLVLFPLNPARLKSFRYSMRNSGAKDDPTDAQLLLEYLQGHREHLTAWKPDDELTREIALLVEERRKTVDLRTKLSNMLRSCLKSFFPQALDWTGESLYTQMAFDFLLKWPTLQSIKRAAVHTVRKFYYGHNCRKKAIVEARLDEIGKAKPLTDDPAILAASVFTVQTLARQIREIIRAIDTFDKRIAELMQQHPDASIFNSLPGAGEILAPRLLVAFGSDRSRWEKASDMQQYSGIAPVTRRSGRSQTVRRRRACPHFLRQTFHEFATHSIHYSPWAHAFYQARRDRGVRHQPVIRALAFKWIRIIHRCWQDKTPYDEGHYTAALRHRGSPLALESMASQQPQSNQV